MKVLKRFLIVFVCILLFLNILIVISGNQHLYKGIRDTYLRGSKKPPIDNPHYFATRKMTSPKVREWSYSQRFGKLESSPEVRELHDKYNSAAYLVVHHDSIIYEEYFEPYSDSTQLNSFSMAKTIVSILIGMAIDDGYIQSVEQKVADFLPEFKNGKGAKLKVKHLLTMSSGINFDENYANPFGFMARAYYGTDLEELLEPYSVVKEPGVDFEYAGGNSLFLSKLLKKATGMSMAEYARIKLWGPIGAENEALWTLDHEGGSEKAYCCFFGVARDFARVGNLYLKGGTLDSTQIISPGYVFDSVRPFVMKEKNGEAVHHYGYAWWLTEYEGVKVFYARGIRGQYVLVVPEHDLIVVRLGASRSKKKLGDHPEDLYEYLKEGFKLAGINASENK